MTTPAMRALARLRPAHGPAGLHLTPLRFSLPVPRSVTTTIRATSPPTLRTFTSLRPLATRPQARPAQPSRHPLPLTSPRRAFSIAAFIDSGVSVTGTLLATLHAVSHTPWFLTIPLFTLGIHLATRLPMTIYTRTIALRRARLTPLLSARASHHILKMAQQQQKQQRLAAGGDAAATAAGQMSMAAIMQQARKVAGMHQLPLYKRWGLQAWKIYVTPLAVFPLWLCGIEALRRMCGGPRGLLGTVVFGPGKGGASATGDLVGAPAQGAGAVDMSSLAMADLPASLATAPPADIQTALAGSAGVDMSMATGGCLWFPDLTVADPLHILPFALSAILLVNVLPRTKPAMKMFLGEAPSATGGTSMGRWQLRMQRGMLILALAIGPATMDLPAALHLYWISSAALSAASTSLVARLMPLPKTPAPAKLVDDAPVLLRMTEQAVADAQAEAARMMAAQAQAARTPDARRPPPPVAKKPAARSRFGRVE